MSILTRRERERLVLELYNEGKTIREIAKEVRISFRDIGVILNKAIEEKIEGIKQEDNIDSEKNQNQEEQQHISLSTQAYKGSMVSKAGCFIIFQQVNLFYLLLPC
jgi:transposase